MIISTMLFVVAIEGERLGGIGESCMRTADCDSPLRCMKNVCREQKTQAAETRPWRPGDAAPPGWHVELRRDKTSWIGGLATFAGAHLITTVVGVSICQNNTCSSWNAVPLVGPLVYTGMMGQENVAIVIAEIVSFAVQTIGIISFAIGLRQREILVADSPQPVTLLPLVGPKLGGVALGGAF